MSRKQLDEAKIVKLYVEEKLSTVKIAKLFGVSYTPILRILKEQQVSIRSRSERHRTYDINETYFDKIDTHEKAYILGMYYADGCNKPYKNESTIALHEKDKDILEKITKIIQPNKPLSYKKGPRQYEFRIENKHISQQLVKLGVAQAKTFNVVFPGEGIVPAEFVNSFVLGYYDGDGGIYINKKEYNRTQLNMTGTEQFIDKILEISNSMDCHWNKFQRFPERGNNIYTINMCGSLQSIRFLEWLYKDCSIFMNRKMDIFNEAKFIQKNKALKKEEKRVRKEKEKQDLLEKKEQKQLEYKKITEIVLDLYSKGKSIREIKDITGQDRRKISKMIKSHGVELKKGGWKTKGNNQYTKNGD
jgi:hypothetical protein